MRVTDEEAVIRESAVGLCCAFLIVNVIAPAFIHRRGMAQRHIIKIGQSGHVANVRGMIGREHIACEVERGSGRCVEAIELRRVDCGFIMISKNGKDSALRDKIETFDGIGPVADDITEAEDGVNASIIDRCEDSLEGFEIAVNIRDESKACHA
jgi:hypothetical protein